MKKLIKFQFIVSCLFTINCMLYHTQNKVVAQPITITQNDIMLQADTMFKMVRVVDPVVSWPQYGPSGEDLVWDFSYLSDYGSNIDTIYTITNPVLTPGLSLFPNTNYVNLFNKNSGQDLYSYHEINSFYDLSLGYYSLIDTSVFVVYEPPYIRLKFPLTYLTEFSGIYLDHISQFEGYPPCDSTRRICYGQYECKVEGWGTVITPSGSYNCLKTKRITEMIDSSYCLQSGVWNFDNVSSFTLYSYGWYTKNIAMAVLSISSPLPSPPPQPPYSVSYLGDPTNSINYKIKKSFKFSPNPATGVIRFENFSEKSNKIIIYDSTGKIITEHTITGNDMSLETVPFADGMYFFKIVDEKGSALENGKFVVNNNK